MKAYLHFGTGTEPRLTVSVPVKENLLWRQKRGLGQTVSGYGLQLVTPYMVQWEGRWRQVYSCCISNASSEYIGRPGHWLATVSIELEQGE